MKVKIWFKYFIRAMLTIGGILFFGLLYAFITVSPGMNGDMTNESVQQIGQLVSVISYVMFIFMVLVAVVIATARTILYTRRLEQLQDNEIVSVTSMGKAVNMEEKK